MPEEQYTHFPQCTHAHTKKTQLFLSVDRERNTGPGLKTKLELARGGHCTGKLKGRKVEGPSNAPRFAFILPESIPIGCSQEGL